MVGTNRVMRGFGGHTYGEKIRQKISLLRGEGVQFDGIQQEKNETFDPVYSRKPFELIE